MLPIMEDKLMHPKLRVLSILIGTLSVPLSLFATLSVTNAIDAHLAYVACLESINLDGIGSQAEICAKR
jgi:hypothetical protein